MARRVSADVVKFDDMEIERYRSAVGDMSVKSDIWYKSFIKHSNAGILRTTVLLSVYVTVVTFNELS